MRHRLTATLLFVLVGTRLAAQEPTIRVDDAGPGIGPKVLERALAIRHVLIPPDSARYLISRASENRLPIVVLGRDVIVEGEVHGDLTAVHGDIYMHPGGTVDGAVTSIGGGVYESSLAHIAGPVRVFHDFTYDITPIAGGYALRYRSLSEQPQAGFALPGIYAVMLPTYDRSNGLSLGFQPRWTFKDMPLVVAPSVMYRSQLGRWDPAMEAEYEFDRRTRIVGRAGGFTRSNDDWIRSDLVNSAVFLFDGNDTRNYYRATAVDASVRRLFEYETATFEPFLGAGLERARSVRPGADASGGPWTLFERSDPHRDDRLRANPPINPGVTASVFGGTTWNWSDVGVVSKGKVNAEVGMFDRTHAFQQLTVDGGISFPTFGTQWLDLAGHFVASHGSTPSQRFAYLGGGATVPTIDLLSEGGDQLVFLDGTYQIPLDQFELPYVGSPVIGIREILGGARTNDFPTLHEAAGVRATLKAAFAEILFDPKTRRGHPSFGFSIGR